VLHSALVEEIGSAGSASGAVSSVSVDDHLRVGATRNAFVTNEIEPQRLICFACQERFD